LLRSVGWIGREGFVTAVYKLPTPDAQCLGTHEFRYALDPHGGDVEEARPWQVAHSLNAPLQVVEDTLHAGEMPQELSFISLEPSLLEISAIKKAENEEALIIRLYNVSDQQVTGKLSVYNDVEAASITTMLEEPIEVLRVDGHHVEFPVRGHQIVTLKLKVKT
jgi:alpha-mannosidase